MKISQLKEMPALVAVPWRCILLDVGERGNVLRFEVVQADIYRYIKLHNWNYFIGDGHKYRTANDDRPVE